MESIIFSWNFWPCVCLILGSKCTYVVWSTRLMTSSGTSIQNQTNAWSTSEVSISLSLRNTLTSLLLSLLSSNTLVLKYPKCLIFNSPAYYFLFLESPWSLRDCLTRRSIYTRVSGFPWGSSSREAIPQVTTHQARIHTTSHYGRRKRSASSECVWIS